MNVPVQSQSVFQPAHEVCVYIRTEHTLGHFFISGLDHGREINVEPGLFEWLGWYQTGSPMFMSLTEFSESGFPVNINYSPVWPLVRYNLAETTEQYYDRSYQVTKEILRRHESEGDLRFHISSQNLILIIFCDRKPASCQLVILSQLLADRR